MQSPPTTPTLAIPPLMQSPPGPETVIDGVRYLYFGGTSYLGLHGHPEVIAAGCRALQEFGVHSATSRSGFGTTPLLIEVETLAAEFFGTESAFWFSSGYSANHVVVPAVAEGVTDLFVESTAHFCVQEAACLAGVPIHAFRSGDAGELAECLRSRLPAGGRPMVMADGVGPSTGRVAPVAEYLEVLAPFAPATLHLDDAHGFGVLGTHGRGVWDAAGLWPHVNGGPDCRGVQLTVCGTLAKALGGFGGIVPGTRAFIEKARVSSHYFDGASAPASPLGGCTAAALRLCLAHPQWRETLRSNVRVVRSGLRELGLAVTEEPTPNIGCVAGSADEMRSIHEGLKQHEILVPYIPTYSGLGPNGILRLAVCAGHAPAQLTALLSALKIQLTS